MKHKSLFLSLLLVFCLVLAGCGADATAPSEAGSDAQKLTMKLGHYDEDHAPVMVDTEVLYTGELVEGVAEGEGSFTAKGSNGMDITYTGSFKNGVPSGFGCTVWASEDEVYLEEGTYRNGLYLPTPSEMIASLGKTDLALDKFTLSEGASAFISEHLALFPTINANAAAQAPHIELDVNALTEATNEFESGLTELTDLTVQSSSSYFYGGITVNVILAADADQNLIAVYYPGKMECAEGDVFASVHALPLASFTEGTARLAVLASTIG